MASVQDHVEVQGSIKNETFAKLELMSMEIYSGHYEDGGPNAVVEQGDTTTFKHIGEPSPKGSKVGVSYRGPNDDQWVFAWHVPGPYPLELPSIELKKKVFGKHLRAGESVDWKKIEKELDESTSSEINTPYFKGAITPAGTNARLDVVFLNLPRN
ncbi:unnamed protein product [Amaranthus hypochondriacus]